MPLPTERMRDWAYGGTYLELAVKGQTSTRVPDTFQRLLNAEKSARRRKRESEKEHKNKNLNNEQKHNFPRQARQEAPAYYLPLRFLLPCLLLSTSSPFPTTTTPLSPPSSTMPPHRSLRPRLAHTLLPLLLLLPYAAPQVTVTIYNPTAQARLAGSSLSPTTVAATATSIAPGTAYTGAAVADPIVLTPPAIPAGFQTQFGLNLEGSTPAGASIGQDGNFLGFSIEFSVSDQVSECRFRLGFGVESGSTD